MRHKIAKPQGQNLKAYGYIRVSTEEQVKEGLSLSAQKAKIEAFATLQDLSLIEVIADEGLSGKDFDRPGLTRLVELVKGKQAEAVIVYKLDRLSRRTRDLLFLIEDVFKKGNTRFFSLTEQIDTETAIGKFFLTLMGAMAQMERELIAERTKATLAYKKEQGESLGHVPYGYQRMDGKLVLNPAEQEIICRVRRLRRKGTSYRNIAEILNRKRVPTRTKDARWHDSSVWYVLNNKRKNNSIFSKKV